MSDLYNAKAGLGDVETSPKPMGPGFFEIEVTKCEVTTSQRTGNPYMAWELTVINDEEYAGRKLFFNTGLTQKSLWTLKRALEALNFEQDSINDDDLTFGEICESVIGEQAVAEVVIREYQGTERDNVQRLLPVGSVQEDVL